jgi:hypothetical protein
MIKVQELNSPDSCLNKSRDDEMLFVLRAHDEMAPLVIEHWIFLRVMSGKNSPEDPQIVNARECVRRMREQRQQGF